MIQNIDSELRIISFHVQKMYCFVEILSLAEIFFRDSDRVIVNIHLLDHISAEFPSIDDIKELSDALNKPIVPCFRANEITTEETSKRIISKEISLDNTPIKQDFSFLSPSTRSLIQNMKRA